MNDYYFVSTIVLAAMSEEKFANSIVSNKRAGTNALSICSVQKFLNMFKNFWMC